MSLVAKVNLKTHVSSSLISIQYKVQAPLCSCPLFSFPLYSIPVEYIAHHCFIIVACLRLPSFVHNAIFYSIDFSI